MSMFVEGGYTVSHIDSGEFISRMGSNNDNADIVTVGFFDNLFTKKGHCVSCGSKVRYKTEKDFDSKFRYDFNSGHSHRSYYDDHDAFVFDGQCDCCGARYFKHQDELHYYIDDSIIDLRKAKINTLMRKSKKWYKFK